MVLWRDVSGFLPSGAICRALEAVGVGPIWSVMVGDIGLSSVFSHLDFFTSRPLLVAVSRPLWGLDKYSLKALACGTTRNAIESLGVLYDLHLP